MLAVSSVTLACPDAGRQRRLASQLADRVESAATMRVSPYDPNQPLRHPRAPVSDEVGRMLPKDRWTLRGSPETDRSRPHLASAALTRSNLHSVASGR